MASQYIANVSRVIPVGVRISYSPFCYAMCHCHDQCPFVVLHWLVIVFPLLVGVVALFSKEILIADILQNATSYLLVPSFLQWLYNETFTDMGVVIH